MRFCPTILFGEIYIMGYISIIAKIDEKVNDLTALAYELDHDYNYNIGSGGICQWYEISCLQKKRAKILSKLQISVQEHTIYDEGGYAVCLDYTVTINGKNRKLSDITKENYWVADTLLPNGKRVSDCATTAQHYYV
jgi:hypothetical protein